MNIIIVSEKHHISVPLIYTLGEHTLVITNSYETPDAFELVAPSVETAEEKQTPLAIFDDEETYYLYQCLHTLFHPGTTDE